MCSYRARRNFKGEKTTTSVGPNLLPAIRIDSGSTSTENSTAEFGLFMNLHKSWQNAVTAEVPVPKLPSSRAPLLAPSPLRTGLEGFPFIRLEHPKTPP
jgi:hypothetical protein